MAAKKEKGFLGEKGQGGPLDLSKLKKDKGVAKPKKDPMMDMARKITGRYRVTAREARDIVTAVSTAAKQMKPVNPKDFDRDLQPNPNRRINAIKDIGTQVSETARAARTGQKGTSAYTGKKRK